MIFYYMPGTCALASHIALEQAGAQYELRRVDFSRNEQRSPEYLGINPKGRVPALVSDQGILTETPAILAYISQIYPAAHLAPIHDPFRFAEVQAFNSYMCATVHVAHAHGPRGSRWVDDPASLQALKRKVPQTMAECFHLIEEEMLIGPWVMGRDYSIADIYLFTISRWLEADGVDIRSFPRVIDHRQRMTELPVVSLVLAVEQQAH
jgi:glutathione S-transferase